MIFDFDGEREGRREELKDEQKDKIFYNILFLLSLALTLHLSVSANDFILSNLIDLESVSKENSEEAIL